MDIYIYIKGEYKMLDRILDQLILLFIVITLLVIPQIINSLY